MTAHTIPEAEALDLCALTKSASPGDFVAGDCAGSIESEFGLVCDPPRKGLRVRIYVHGGNRVKRNTIDFGLWDCSDRPAIRIYQLTIANKSTHTHTEDGVKWYGSHEHLGDKNYIRSDANDKSFQEALQYFLSKTNIILDGPLINPFDPSTFELQS